MRSEVLSCNLAPSRYAAAGRQLSVSLPFCFFSFRQTKDKRKKKMLLKAKAISIAIYTDSHDGGEMIHASEPVGGFIFMATLLRGVGSDEGWCF